MDSESTLPNKHGTGKKGPSWITVLFEGPLSGSTLVWGSEDYSLLPLFELHTCQPHGYHPSNYMDAEPKTATHQPKSEENRTAFTQQPIHT